MRSGDTGENKARTNVELGNEVPAKQGWDLNSLGVVVIPKTTLTADKIVKLNEMLFNSELSFKIDNSAKYYNNNRKNTIQK